MKAEELAILLKAREQHEAAMAQLAPTIREMQKAFVHGKHFFAAIDDMQKQALMLQRALDIPGLKTVLDALSNPALLRALRSLQEAQERVSLITHPTGGMSFVGPLVLHTPLPQHSTVEVAAPIYVPEDDPAWLRDQLAQKNTRIAELEGRIRLLEGSDEWPWEDAPPFQPSDPNWLN